MVFTKGHKIWLGRHHSKITKKQISDNLKRAYEEGRKERINKGAFKKGSHAHLGFKHSEETKEKIKHTFFKKGQKAWNKGIKGENSHVWKGGWLRLVKEIRKCTDSKNWIKKCLLRDNFICQECGRKDCKLEVHHKKSLAKIIQENKIYSYEEALNCAEIWDIDNGETLCYECHNKTRKGRAMTQ